MTTFDPNHPRFAHDQLDAYTVAREALVRGDVLARQLPRGFANLGDQLRRALLSALLGVAEAASRSGADRLARFRCARGEASEAAAALASCSTVRCCASCSIGSRTSPSSAR